MLIKKPKILSKEKFSPQINTLQSKFGLPENIKFCSSCVYSNQKPLSAKEYDHNKGTKKISLVLTKKMFVMHARMCS